MDTVIPLVLAGVFFLGHSRNLLSRLRRASARRALARISRTPIGDLKDGEWAKVTGIVGALGSQKTSPIAGRACIGFRLLVADADRGTDVIVLTKEDCGTFSVTDDTGRVNVSGPFLVALDGEQDWSSVPRSHFDFLAGNNISTKGIWLMRRFDFREALLLAGDHVTVLGQAFLETAPAGPTPSFRAPRRIRRMRGSDRQPVIVADAREQT